MKTVNTDPSKKPVRLIAGIMGYTITPMTAPMKHGLAMEPHAKRKLRELLSCHKKIAYTETGLVIKQDEPFLAASPDMLISCLCHGKAVCEIKCPYSIRDETPTSTNLAYLTTRNNRTTVNTSHKYFSQMQTQMAILNVQSCYFFVYTAHGYHLETVTFCEERWKELQRSSQKMWYEYIPPKY
jgi:hypothetical protein